MEIETYECAIERLKNEYKARENTPKEAKKTIYQSTDTDDLRRTRSAGLDEDDLGVVFFAAALS